MKWAERIIGLQPAIVTGAWLLMVILAAVMTEALPIGSMFSWWGTPITTFLALLSIVPMFVWTGALRDVTHSRLGADTAKRHKEERLFRSAGFWAIVWCVALPFLPRLPLQFFAVAALVSLIVGYLWLRAVWVTASALLSFENSDNAFWTFVQILYFPIGVWFLQSRLQSLLSAPQQAAPSPT